MNISRTRPRKRFWIEVVSAATGLVLVAANLLVPDWIEVLGGADLDHRSGALEWGVTAALLLITIVSGTVAAAEWRRPRQAAPL